MRVSGDVLAVLNVIPQVGLTRLSPARRHNLGSDLSGVRLGPGSETDFLAEAVGFTGHQIVPILSWAGGPRGPPI